MLPNLLNTGFPTLALLGEDTPVGGPVGSVGIGERAGQATQEYIGNALSKYFTSVFDSTRLVTGILGLILIAGGIFLFKPVKDTIVNVGKTAAKAAA